MKALLLPSQVSSPSTPLSLSSGPMCFFTISTFSCARRYTSTILFLFVDFSSRLLSDFVHRHTRKRVSRIARTCVRATFSFLFFFFFLQWFDNAQDADVFWRGRGRTGRTQGGELRRSMTSFHPIREITSEKNGIMYSGSLKNFRFSTISYFKLNYFTYLFFASSFYIRVEVIRNFLPCISSHLRFLEEKLEEILKRSKYLNFHALSLSLSLGTKTL